LRGKKVENTRENKIVGLFSGLMVALIVKVTGEHEIRPYGDL
jgi:hypothetical protein